MIKKLLFLVLTFSCQIKTFQTLSELARYRKLHFYFESLKCKEYFFNSFSCNTFMREDETSQESILYLCIDLTIVEIGQCLKSVAACTFAVQKNEEDNEKIDILCNFSNHKKLI